MVSFKISQSSCIAQNRGLTTFSLTLSWLIIAKSVSNAGVLLN